MSEKNQIDFCTTIYRRVVAILEYDVSTLGLLKTPISLLKPTAPNIRLDVEDYNLSKITNNKIEIFYVPGNHITMLDNDNVMFAINGDLVEDPTELKIKLG